MFHITIYSLYVQNMIPRNIKENGEIIELSGSIGWVARSNGHYTLKVIN